MTRPATDPVVEAVATAWTVLPDSLRTMLEARLAAVPPATVAEVERLRQENVSLRERLVSCGEAASWTAADRATVERARLCEEHRVRVTYSAESGKWMAWDETGFAAIGATRAEVEDGVLARARALLAETHTETNG